MAKSVAQGIPDAWPLLLSRDQACAYLGVSASTLFRVCPVAPVDLGANVLRYHRPEIDAWVATLPPRLPKHLQADTDHSNDDDPRLEDQPEDRRQSAVERARQRALGGPSCRRSRTSSGSSGKTAA